MDRRGFLRRAGLAIAALGIDPELLIWQPRQQVAVPAMPSLMGVDYGAGESMSVWLMVWNEHSVEGIFPRRAFARDWQELKAIVERTNGELVQATRTTYAGGEQRFFARRIVQT